MIGRPGTIDVHILAHQLLKTVQLGVQIIQIVQRQSLHRHRDFRTAEFQLAVVADNHVLQLNG